MNLSKVKISSIDRIIAHEIHPKTAEKDAYAKTNTTLLKFQKSEKDILIKRISEALSNTSKTFQLDYEDKTDSSMYAFLPKLKSLKDKDFVEATTSMAHDLAYSHFRTRIPGGYCLFGSGFTSEAKIYFFVIKAELQEVFNIIDNQLKLIKDVFLSPAKDFYKIGFFVESGNRFLPFMYDDQFSLQKKDLTEYFYGSFLGLTTDKIDKLKTKNFYDDTKHFVEVNVDNIPDRIGILKALSVLYREDASGLISAKEFSEKYFEGELKSRFDKTIVEEKYPISFTKDISLIENRLELQRVSIPLTYTVSIIGSSSELEGMDVIDDPNQQDLRNMEPEINSGRIRKIIVLKQIE